MSYEINVKQKKKKKKKTMNNKLIAQTIYLCLIKLMSKKKKKKKTLNNKLLTLTAVERHSSFLLVLYMS